MKKNFENPVMNISLFDMESVVTESGAPTTNAGQAEDSIKGATNITTVDFSKLGITF